MGPQLGIPAALRRYGLTVETVAGWETRGSATFNPRGVVCHWTAGPKAGDRPSLRICINGRKGLPGPLCNVFLTRAGVAVVVAAGRANHAGAGGWNGLTGNSSVFGIEAEASGNEWTEAQRSAYPRVVAALVDLAGGNVANVCGHYEWATPAGRKVDIAGYTMQLMRAQVSGLRLGGGPATLTTENMTRLQDLVGAAPDGVWGPDTARAVQAWLGVTADGVFGPTSTKALQLVVGVNPDGIWGPATTDALNRYLEETDMPTPKDLTDHFETVAPGWSWGPRNAASADRKLTEVLANVAALTEAVAQEGDLDVSAIKAAVADALAEHTEQMAAIVESLRTTVDGLSDRIDAEAREALTAALDRAREAVTA